MDRKQYWIERTVNASLMSERSVIDEEKKLLLAYQYANIQIQKEINSFFEKYAVENKIPYSEVRKRLTSGERKSFNVLLQEWYNKAKQSDMSPEFKAKLKKLADQVYVTRLDTLQAAIQFQIEEIKANQHTWMTALMSDNYMVTYYNGFFNTLKGTGIGLNFSILDRAGIEKAIRTKWDGANYSDRLWADKTKLITTLEKVIPRSFSMGLNSKILGHTISKEMNTSKNRGVALARTEVNFICNQASLDMYRIANLYEYEYLATLDMRTSDICRSLDGNIFKVSQASVGVNFPPMHVSCRSTTIAKLEDDDMERIARDSDGDNIKVARKMSQESWIDTYVPEQDRDRLLKFISKYKSV